MKENPYEVKTENQGQVEWAITPIITKPPPLRLSTIIGDCLVNARAAVDYVMWEIATRFFNPPIDTDKANDRKLSAFPLFNAIGGRDSSYENRFNGLTNRKVPTPVIDEIKATQPYNNGQLPLWWHELVNGDKHRMPLLTVAAIPHADFFVVYGGTEWNQIAGRWPGTLQTAHGAIGLPNVEVDCKPTIFISFADPLVPRIPADAALQQIVECVANAIPRFERFLP